MARSELILKLVGLLMLACQPPTDLSQNKECDRYRFIANLTVDPNMCVKPGFKTDGRNRLVCVQNCNDMKQVICVPAQSSLKI